MQCERCKRQVATEDITDPGCKYCDTMTWVPLDSLVPNDQNPRYITKDELKKLKRSIEYFGFVDPIIVNKFPSRENVIVGGHQRHKAAKALGMTLVPVTYVSMPKDQEHMLNIALNAVTGDWDQDKLAQILLDLQKARLDVTLTGMDEPSITKILQDREDNIAAATEDVTPEAPLEPLSKPGELWILGDHRLLAGDATKTEDVAALMDGDELADLVLTDPPYGVSYKGTNNPNGRAWDVLLNDDLRGDSLRDFIRDMFINYAKVTKDNPAVYCFFASNNHREFEDALHRAGFKIKQTLIWEKGHVLGHSDYHWSHEPCQPAGTMVRKVINARATSKGRQGAFSDTEEVPIEQLKDGDLVVSYEPRGCVVHTRGRPIKTAKRHYEGDLIGITAGGKFTKSTDAHQFTIRLNEQRKNCQIVYLMRKGEWWRIGQVRLFNSRGFGLASRLADEKGDEAWIVTIASDTLEARMLEQAISCKYGIPTTHWSFDVFTANPEKRRSLEAIRRIYEIIGTGNVQKGATKLMVDYHLKRQYPLITNGTEHAFSKRMSRTVRACNLRPEIMQLPIPTTGEQFVWETITSITQQTFSGEVYSIDVDRDQHYIADGIITHNCLYAIKNGHNCEWLGDRTHRTVLLTTPIPDLEELKKEELLQIILTIRRESDVLSASKDASKDYLHSTQKPVELFRRFIMNSTRPRDVVLDFCVGGGTCIIACESTKRKCRAMEINPVYVDVCLTRWANLTGKEPVRASDHKTWSEIRAAHKSEQIKSGTNKPED